MAASGVVWDELAPELRTALGWAKAIEPGVVGTRTVLIGMVRVGGEAAELLEALGCPREDLFQALRAVKPAPRLDLDAVVPALLEEWPSLTGNLRRALERALALQRDVQPGLPLGPQHVLGALLELPDSTAYKGLAAALGPRFPIAGIQDVYRTYLEAPGAAPLRDMLENRFSEQRSSPGAAHLVSDRVGDVAALAFARAGNVLATGAADGSVTVWDYAAGDVITVHDTHVGVVWTLAFAPDDGQLASAGEDSTVQLRAPMTATPPRVLRGHTGGVRALAFSPPHGDQLATVGRDGVVRLWDSTTDGVIAVLAGADGPLVSVAFAGDGELVGVGGDGAAWLWDVGGGSPRLLAGSRDGHVVAIACSSDGSRVAQADADGGVLTFATHGPQAGRARSASHDHGMPEALTLSPGGGTLAVAGGGGAIRLFDADSGALIRELASHGGRVQRLAFSPDQTRLASVGDGSLMVQDVALTETASAQPPLSDRLEWQHDAPARTDRLGRKKLVEVLATRIDRMSKETPRTSFLIHIDGPWGSGKTTVVDFLGDRLCEDGWLIVKFDAWRQSRVGPPWWALLTSLRATLSRDLRPRRKRWRLRAAETLERLSDDRASHAVSGAILVAAVVALLLLKPVSGNVGQLASVFSAVVAAVTTVWLGGRLAGRFLMWESATGARVYEQSHQDPTEGLAEHFAWLVQRAGKPVAFFIDDLDRCGEQYVVDLLEAVQTLVRDTSGQAARGAYHPFFVVAADGRWIRRSYERTYACFEDAVSEPGRPLGYLFLDKIFQLTVPVPTVSASQQETYLRGLLGPAAEPPERTPAELAAGRRRISQSESQEEILGVVNNASPQLRVELAGAAVEKLSDPVIERETEHQLQKFAPLLEHNPRSMKRFVNAYSVSLPITLLEGRQVDPDPLALWTILRMRWPDLAEHLCSHPEDAERLLGSPDTEREPDHIDQLTRVADVRRVAGFKGGLLTSEVIRELSATERLPARGAAPSAPG